MLSFFLHQFHFKITVGFYKTGQSDACGQLVFFQKSPLRFARRFQVAIQDPNPTFSANAFAVAGIVHKDFLSQQDLKERSARFIFIYLARWLYCYVRHSSIPLR